MSRSADVAGDRPFYALYAEAYDSLIADPVDQWVNAVDGELRAAGFAAADVLDAGCGTGRHAQALIQRGHVLTLLDASSALLRIASRRCPGAETILGDLCRPSTTRRFHGITCRGVLNDLTSDDERDAALNSFAALTHHRGILLLDVRESAGSQRRADGRWRTSSGQLPGGGQLSFSSRPTWRAGHIIVDERYELTSSTMAPPTVHEYRFEMRPWTTKELTVRLSAAGFGNIRVGPGIGRRSPDRLFAFAERGEPRG